MPSVTLFMLVVLVLAVAPLHAQPVVERSPDRINLAFGNGTSLSLALRGDEVLGLRAAAVDGQSLRSDATVVRPVIIQDRGPDPVAWERMRLRDVKVVGDTVRVECELGRTDGRDAWRRWLVMQGDKPHVDSYLFHHLQLPSEATRLERLDGWA